MNLESSQAEIENERRNFERVKCCKSSAAALHQYAVRIGHAHFDFARRNDLLHQISLFFSKYCSQKRLQKSFTKSKRVREFEAIVAKCESFLDAATVTSPDLPCSLDVDGPMPVEEDVVDSDSDCFDRFISSREDEFEVPEALSNQNVDDVSFEGSSVFLSDFGLSNLSVFPAPLTSLTFLDLSANLFSNFLCSSAAFPLLSTLILDSNMLTANSFSQCGALSMLSSVSLNKNSIQDLSILNDLARVAPSLSHLSLLLNPCCPFEEGGNSYAFYQ
jgi:hypothetical protein